MIFGNNFIPEEVGVVVVVVLLLLALFAKSSNTLASGEFGGR